MRPEREDAAYEDTACEELARLLPPVPGERDVPSAPYLHHKDRLMQLIDDTADHQKNAAAPKARPRLLRPAVLMPAAALALAGALAVTFTGGGGASGDASARPHETATVLLDRLAGTAAKSDVRPVRQDQFVYVKSVGAGAEMTEDGASKLDPRGEHEVWKSQQVKRIHKIGETHDDEGYAPMYELGGSPAGIDRPTYQWLASLPTDPDVLLKELYRMTEAEDGQEKAQAVFEQIGRLLGDVMPPENAAALYKAAAKIPGVTRQEDAVDAAGRHGFGIARVDKRTWVANEWIFDRDSLAYLGEREYRTKDFAAGKKGDVLAEYALLKHGIVDHYRERPATK
ncbi:CU044_5270 family protein [Streptomyces sp. Rer75]|uniref:CU044_5270 family protein n=1 Tax=unclassified Streptomyces TaxID=2593676 RepID=UPI0015CFE981|nr:CU044_5270 family protein [Streptomyces sp. Rer75]QLH21154.1 CU044_5270 family protein [Streptomyces sp. Rer75]